MLHYLHNYVTPTRKYLIFANFKVYVLHILLEFREITMSYSTGLSLEERVERAKRLLADKQAQKVKEEQEKSKNSETERREMGKNIQAMKKKQEDDEIRKAAEERQKEKEEQRLALIKIKVFNHIVL